MSKLAKVLQAAAGNTPAGDLAAAIDFDGTNDYLSRSSDMTGNTDSKTFTFSCWIYKKSDLSYSIFNNRNATGFQVFAASQTKITTLGRNADGTFVLNMQNSASVMSLNTWTHVLIAIDLSNSANRSIYINDVDKTSLFSFSSYVNDTIDFTQSDHFVATLIGTAVKFDGRLSNVFLDYTYRDLSVTNNRRLFITEDGKPADGQAGLNPIMYMPLDDPEDIGYNAGTGGDFTVNGVMARSGRGPNQYNAAASSMFTSGQNVTLATVGLTTTGYTISANVKTTLGVTVIPFWVNGSGTNYQSQMQVTGTTGVLRLNVYDYATSTTVMRITADTPLVADRFYNIQMVVDPASTANTKFYVDGVQVATTVLIFVSRTNHILTSTAQVFGTSGTFSDVYFTDGKIDLSADNPFYDTETNKPKYLGESGELPTGSSPLIYLPLRGNDAGKNLGTGGDFTVNSGPFTGARGPSEFIGRSVEGDDSTGYLSRTSLTGATSSKTLTFVCAFYPDAAVTAPRLLSMNDTGVGGDEFHAYKQNVDSSFRLTTRSSSPAANNLAVNTSTNSASNNTWHIVLVSVDLSDTGKRHCYIDGVSDGTFTTYVDQPISFDSMDVVEIGRDFDGLNYWPGYIGFMYMSTSYIDFSQEANRLKFVDGLGYPVDLQPAIDAGDIATPLIHMKFDDTSALGTNSGTGGDFTVNGTIKSGADVSV